MLPDNTRRDEEAPQGVDEWRERHRCVCGHVHLSDGEPTDLCMEWGCPCDGFTPRPKPELVHLWTICPDCGHVGAHHSYTDRGGDSVGVRCG
jgi:hypothetical protein